MTERHGSRDVFFLAGPVLEHVTGGTLCDRMIMAELRRTRSVHLVVPQLRALGGVKRLLLAGLLNNLRNLFRAFPEKSLLFVDHGIYRDCFIAVNFWKWCYRCQVVGVVYHLDYELPGIRGGQAFRKLVERLMIHVYDFALTISRSTAEHLQLLGHDSRKIALIPVSRRFGPQPYEAKTKNNDTVRFLFVGSIEPRKGLLDAIHALGAYRGPARIIFDCVGQVDRDGRHFHELLEAAKRYDQVSVNFPDSVSEDALARYFGAADAFLFPSRWEGYGIAIEEAMCFALPILAYTAGAIPELVSDGITGWLVPAGDLDALKRAVETCISNPEERRQRGFAGLAKARETARDTDLAAILSNAIAAAGGAE